MQFFTATTKKNLKATVSQHEIQLAVTCKPVAFPASSEKVAPARRLVSYKCDAARGAPATSRDGTVRWRARLARLMVVEQLTIAGEGTTCSVLYRSHDTITDPRDSMIVIYIVDWHRIRGNWIR